MARQPPPKPPVQAGRGAVSYDPTGPQLPPKAMARGAAVRGQAPPPKFPPKRRK